MMSDIKASHTEHSMRDFTDLDLVNEILHFVLQAEPLELDSD